MVRCSAIKELVCECVCSTGMESGRVIRAMSTQIHLSAPITRSTGPPFFTTIHKARALETQPAALSLMHAYQLLVSRNGERAKARALKRQREEAQGQGQVSV